MKIEEQQKQELELSNGAQFFRCALQVNPHHYANTYRGQKNTRTDEATYVKAIVGKARELGIDVLAHILVCFLGYALWKTLQQWQSRAGLGDSPRTILTELSRITAADIMLPLADGSARELRIRCVVRPDRSQALLIDRLGLTLPERLRTPQTVEM